MKKYIANHFDYTFQKDDNDKKIFESGVQNIFDIDSLKTTMPTMKMEIDELCRYCKIHNIEDVFKSSFQEPIERYIITENILRDNSEGGEETYKFLKIFADEWNEELSLAKKSGIEKNGIDVYSIIKDGLVFSSFVGHDYIKDFINELECIEYKRIRYEEVNGKTILDAFIQKNFDEYLDTIKDDDEEESLLDEFYEMILNDKNFFACTNKTMRETYACDLWKKNSVRIKYENLFGTPYRMALEMDKIYGNYRKGLYSNIDK